MVTTMFVVKKTLAMDVIAIIRAPHANICVHPRSTSFALKSPSLSMTAFIVVVIWLARRLATQLSRIQARSEQGRERCRETGTNSRRWRLVLFQVVTSLSASAAIEVGRVAVCIRRDMCVCVCHRLGFQLLSYHLPNNWGGTPC